MSVFDAFWVAPPVARTLTALTLVTSVLVHGGALSAGRIVFLLPWIFKFPMPEVWRFFTPFLLTGPNFSILFDTMFLWRYSKALETESSRFSQPGDFFIYLIFVCTFIILTLGIGMGGYIFTPALVLAIAFTFSQENRYKKTSFFVVSFQAMWLPWAILTMTLVLGGPIPALHQFTGLLAAHMYDFLTRIWPMFGGGTNYIFTPNFVKVWFGGDQTVFTTKAYGTAFRPANKSLVPGSTLGGKLGGILPNSWSYRGQGRRLGEGPTEEVEVAAIAEPVAVPEKSFDKASADASGAEPINGLSNGGITERKVKTASD